MKKTISMLIVSAMLILLCGCSQNKQVLETYAIADPFNKTISIICAYGDEEGNTIKSDSKIKVQIVNSNNETVYEGTVKSSKSEAGQYEGYYYSQLSIPMDKVKEGTTSNGTLYYWVETSGVKTTDTYREELINVLPTKGVQLDFGELPIEVETISKFTGNVTEVARFEEVSYEKDGQDDWYVLQVKGTLTKSLGGMYYTYNCEVYDMDGNLVETAWGITDAINPNDTFVDEINLYSLEPGQSYKVVFTN